jgi:hypothetical protein
LFIDPHRGSVEGIGRVPLVDLWKSSPATISQFTIEQVVTTAGDGSLRDESLSSRELREYLREVRSERLFEYIDGCLTRGFSKSGAVLQDLINELGRRLDYEVENGLYQGRSNAVGFDGIWRSPDGHALVVEVKTTDAYRINLDTIAGYREALVGCNKITKQSSILVVVGRSDTGDIEAQVRGSKHAWDIRLISADALVKLVSLKESTDEEETVFKIQSLLKPFEYTRLDNIIDVMFAAAKDVEASSDLERGLGAADGAEDQNPRGASQEHTSPDVLNGLRKRIVSALGEQIGGDLIAKSRAQYQDVGKAVRVCCSISKRYQRGTYWYAYHPHWDHFLSEGDQGFFVLGCVDKNVAYALPRGFMGEVLDKLYTTHVKGTTKMYWHVHLEEGTGGEMYFLIGKSGQRVPILKYGFTL